MGRPRFNPIDQDIFIGGIGVMRTKVNGERKKDSPDFTFQRNCVRSILISVKQKNAERGGKCWTCRGRVFINGPEVAARGVATE